MFKHTDKDSVEYKKFREKDNARNRARYATDDEFRARCLMRGALHRFLKQTGGKKWVIHRT
jgi:hypothetical protein